MTALRWSVFSVCAVALGSVALLAVLRDPSAVLVAAALPTVMCVIGVLGTSTGNRRLLTLSLAMLGAYIVLTVWSVGPYFGLAAIGLAVAASTLREEKLAMSRLESLLLASMGVSAIGAVLVVSEKAQELHIATAFERADYYQTIPPWLYILAFAFPILSVAYVLRLLWNRWQTQSSDDSR